MTHLVGMTDQSMRSMLAEQGWIVGAGIGLRADSADPAMPDGLRRGVAEGWAGSKLGA